MALELRGDISSRLNDAVLDRIRKALKPTKTAEALAVAKELKGVAVSLEEVAEIVNISEPGRNTKARVTDYEINELRKHPSLIITTTPKADFIRYIG